MLFSLLLPDLLSGPSVRRARQSALSRLYFSTSKITTHGRKYCLQAVPAARVSLDVVPGVNQVL